VSFGANNTRTEFIAGGRYPGAIRLPKGESVSKNTIIYGKILSMVELHFFPFLLPTNFDDQSPQGGLILLFIQFQCAQFQPTIKSPFSN
jgi:hypothetical protein